MQNLRNEINSTRWSTHLVKYAKIISERYTNRISTTQLEKILWDVLRPLKCGIDGNRGFWRWNVAAKPLSSNVVRYAKICLITSLPGDILCICVLLYDKSFCECILEGFILLYPCYKTSFYHYLHKFKLFLQHKAVVLHNTEFKKRKTAA